MKIPVMVDSGAYSAWTKKESLDLDGYIAYIHAMLKKDPDILYVNLDVIGDGKGSYDNWREMVRQGLNPIPVYHVVTEVIWLEKYLKKVDYIGLGAIVKMSSDARTISLDRIFEDYLIDEERMPKFKVHGMGITSFPLMKRYPWYSIDSTSWLQAGMYGKVLLPRRRNGEWAYTTNPRVLSFSNQSPSVKEKGKHFDNVSPHERHLLKMYLEETGYKEGVSKMVDGEEVVVGAGVYNRWEPRTFLNALYFARFVSQLPWPRPFNAERPKGLFS